MKIVGRGVLLLLALVIPACGGGGGSSAPPPVILSATTAAFTAAEGGTDPADQVITMTGTSTLGMGATWTAVSDQPWFTVTPAAGAINPSQVVNLNLHVNATYQLQAWVGATSLTGVPVAREVHSAVWNGTQMIVWGGTDAAAPNTQLTSGGRYTPDNWVGTVTSTGMPTERHGHSAVWTGTEMIIWGGWKFGTGFFNTGGRYAPDAWTASTTETIGAPTARETHTAVWTGSRMIIWGGWNGSTFQDGKFYNPVTDSWTGNTSLSNAPVARQDHVAVWTGGQMVVWGGRASATYATSVNTGGMYDPVSDTWPAATSTTGAPTARSGASAVWTGREMLVWGGIDTSSTPLNTGARFDPTTNSWLGAIPTAGAPVARKSHRAVWTGTRMIVWGGGDAGSLNTGGIYQPPIPPLGTNTAVVTITPTVGTPLTITVTLTVTP